MAILQEYHAPSTLAEAVALLGRREARLVPLAGGAQLVGQLETRQRPEVDGVVDLRSLALDEIWLQDNLLHLGATATLSQVIAHEAAGTLADSLLSRTARAEGPLNWRNAATVGGIIATAADDSEFYAALLALDGTVLTQTADGASATPLRDFVRQPGALITAVTVSWTTARGGHARVARTPSDRPIVAAVVVSTPNQPRIAFCGVGDRPVLHGDMLAPPDDFKGSADYRRAMAEIVLARALAEIAG
ncbi:MAG: hypothetical protein HC802_12450 [Caldilineaceae bacterium]|nr:hypothetical protein [Caldilineaceae bacterium]